MVVKSSTNRASNASHLGPSPACETVSTTVAECHAGDLGDANRPEAPLADAFDGGDIYI